MLLFTVPLDATLSYQPVPSSTTQSLLKLKKAHKTIHYTECSMYGEVFSLHAVK